MNIHTWLALILNSMKFMQLYYEVWYARTLAFQRPIVAKFFILFQIVAKILSCNCSSAALLSVKSGDYTDVSYGSNIPSQSKVHSFCCLRSTNVQIA